VLKILKTELRHRTKQVAKNAQRTEAKQLEELGLFGNAGFLSSIEPVVSQRYHGDITSMSGCEQS
jgi:hypothetical protein